MTLAYRLCAVFAFLVVCGFSRQADAACRDDRYERTVYEQSFENGNRTARLAYTVYARGTACEHGSRSTFGHPVDTRRCEVRVVERSIKRTIVVTSANRKQTSVGDSSSSLPDKGDTFGVNCNRSEDEHHRQNMVDEALGQRSTWQTHISNDRKDVEDVLAVIGMIDS